MDCLLYKKAFSLNSVKFCKEYSLALSAVRLQAVIALKNTDFAMSNKR